LNLRGEQLIDAEPPGPSYVGVARITCAGLSLLHIDDLLSPPSSKRIVSIRIMIDKGWAFAVNEDHSSYDDAAQVALKELLASGANARETGGLVLDSPAWGVGPREPATALSFRRCAASRHDQAFPGH